MTKSCKINKSLKSYKNYKQLLEIFNELVTKKRLKIIFGKIVNGFRIITNTKDYNRRDNRGSMKNLEANEIVIRLSMITSRQRGCSWTRSSISHETLIPVPAIRFAAITSFRFDTAEKSPTTSRSRCS